ncbi:MAG TPA: CHAT domain-containing protein [Pyrinomonadaceae bacterium]|nr:CHAT domain-containing protein [Pyrinomonadaceae bacterium]
MTKKIRILFLSSNPWTTTRILVDEEAREIFEKLQEGPARDRFELHRHAATRPIDLQRLLMLHEPHIVHFSGHGSKQHKIILGGKPGRGKQVDPDGLVKVFALYKKHVRLVVLNACFTKTQAKSLSEVIDYSVGAGKGIGDKEGVAFAGAFYRALSFGKSVTSAFESAKAELALTRMPRTRGLGLFVRKGVNKNDAFPKCDSRAGKAAGSRRAPAATRDRTSQTYSGALRHSTSRSKRRSKSAETEIRFAGLTNDALEPLQTGAEFCEHDHSRSLQTHKSPRALMRQDEPSGPVPGRQKTKGAVCVNASSIVESLLRRCPHACITVSVTVFKVASKFD